MSTLIYPFRERDWISVGDVGTALDFVFFAVVSFFGVGNIASLNRSAYSTPSPSNDFFKRYCSDDDSNLNAKKRGRKLVTKPERHKNINPLISSEHS